MSYWSCAHLEYPHWSSRLEPGGWSKKEREGQEESITVSNFGFKPEILTRAPSLHTCNISTPHCKMSRSMSMWYTLLHTIKHCYLQSLVDDAGRAWRAGGVVIQLLLQAAQQAAEVCGRVVGPSSPILDGAERFWEQTQLPETLLEKTLGRFSRFV